jgi:hypothetical protein
MRRAILAITTAGLLTAGTLGSGSTAAAHHADARGCPPPFAAYDLQEHLALAAEHGVPESEVYAAIDTIDNNGDTVLCFQFLPGGWPNIIDNRSAH